jgi:putative nucleotidyltransferase with HDIG domain
MSRFQPSLLSQPGVSSGAIAPRRVAEGVDLLRRTFDVEFTVLDAWTGEVVFAGAGQPNRDWTARAEICREVARRERPEFIDEEDPLLVLAVPLGGSAEDDQMAVATFVTRPVTPDENMDSAARLLGMPADEVVAWARRQKIWAPEMLRKVAEMAVERLAGDRRIADLLREARSLSEHVSSTYEEISLLYRLTQNLKLSQSDEQLGQTALEWLAEVVPAKGLALLLTSHVGLEEIQPDRIRPKDVFLTSGRCPIDHARFAQLILDLGLRPSGGPVVANRSVTRQDSWSCAVIRQLVVTPLAEGENLFGWLAAMNHVDDGEFGTVEASLMSSVGTILGIHGSNIDLYRQQSEMFAGIVRALASAIDAKDEYTRGHSHRVAQISVRLAGELGCDEKAIGRIYLAGLLHDIGKIGVDDNVLRKPDKLTEAEYEHIKNHVTIGHRILIDLKKMDDVLPVVLHHHEAWDGSGYPQRLPSDEIPRTARIVAVADAFDAMSSDRPYRKGMPDAKIDVIFREGAGKQWDPDVVAAFFRVRDDIREIVRRERIDLEVELERFT